jgi:hypothetical protein
MKVVIKSIHKACMGTIINLCRNLVWKLEGKNNLGLMK